jgi:hypothetical protein
VRRGLLAAVAAGAAFNALAPAAAAYRMGPPAAHTGGFGEPTCAACHAGSDGAPGGHSAFLSIDAPARYEPGETYDIRIRLVDPDLAAAGFQLAVRFAEGEAAGAQAGALTGADSTVTVVAGAAVEYASHTLEGARPREPGRAAWVVRWTAPEGGAVVFHAAGNAANDDDSEFGDRIHTAEFHARDR